MKQVFIAIAAIVIRAVIAHVYEGAGHAWKNPKPQ